MLNSTIDPNQRRSIGRRIHVTGNSNSGKSTLGKQLATALNVPLVELDAINWQPDWVGLNETDPEELFRRICEATSGEDWVVAGSYHTFTQKAFWSRLDTIIWLDLPMPQLIWRMFTRSWRRWRRNELLWGTNHERFWPQFLFWRKKDSLLYWIITQHTEKRRNMLNHQTDPRWAHIQFIRLRSSADVKAFSHAQGLTIDLMYAITE